MKDLDYLAKGQHVQKGFQQTLLHKSGYPLFQQLELTLTGLCNRFCEFCPRNDPKIFSSSKNYLSLDILQSSFQQLSKYNYAGKISCSGFGEPFTHPQLDLIVRSARKLLPNCTIDIITNGDLFDQPQIASLLEECLFDRILISAYDGKEQLSHLSSKFRKYLDQGKIVIRSRFLSEDNDEFDLFSNRTGLVDYQFNKSLDDGLANPNVCFYPYYNIFVDSDGDILSCSHDWSKKQIFGNLYSNNIIDIWFSEPYKSFRYQMSVHQRSMEPCSTCNVNGQLYGHESYKAWCTDKSW